MSPVQVFLTRPQGRNGTVPARLRALCMNVHELPALELRPLPAPASVPLPADYDVVVFVSRYAAERYLQWLGSTPNFSTSRSAGAPAPSLSTEWPTETIAATVGASSAQALLKSGRIPAGSVLHPPADEPAQDSESLLNVLLAHGVTLKRVLIVRGVHGREWLGGSLQARGVQVDFLPVYERVNAAWSPEMALELRAALSRPERCVFLLTSGEGVRAVVNHIDALGLLEEWSKAAFVAIHERIGATLQSVLASRLDGGVRRMALCRPDDDSIVRAIHSVAAVTAKP